MEKKEKGLSDALPVQTKLQVASHSSTLGDPWTGVTFSLILDTKNSQHAMQKQAPHGALLVGTAGHQWQLRHAVFMLCAAA